MAFEAGSIYGTIGLNEEPAVKALRATVAEAKNTKKGVEEALGQAGEGGAKAFLHGLRKEAGRRSVLGESIELLAGGGVIAGIQMAADRFKELGTKIAEVSDQYREGAITGEELAAQMVREVPILGAMTQAWDALREAVTGEKVEMQKQIDEEAAIEAGLKRHQEVLKQNIDLQREMTEVIRSTEDKIALANAPEYAKAGLARGLGTEAAIRAEEERYRKAQLAMGHKDLPTVAQAQAGILGAQAAIDAAKADRLAMGSGANKISPTMRKGFDITDRDSGMVVENPEWRAAQDSVQEANKRQVDAISALTDAQNVLTNARQHETEMLRLEQLQRAQNDEDQIKAMAEENDRVSLQMHHLKEVGVAFKESVETPAEYFKRIATDMKMLAMGGVIGNDSLGRGLGAAILEYQAQMGGAANYGVAGQQFRGSRVVTAADVPAERAVPDLLKQLLAEVKKQTGLLDSEIQSPHGVTVSMP